MSKFEKDIISQFEKDIINKLDGAQWTSLGKELNSVDGVMRDPNNGEFLPIEASYRMQTHNLTLGLLVVIKVKGVVASSWGAWDYDIADVLAWFNQIEREAMESESASRNYTEKWFAAL